MDESQRFRDKILICVDCKEEFAFTISAQEYFSERGFTENPERCRTCFAQCKQDQSRQSKLRYREDADYHFGGRIDARDDDHNDGGNDDGSTYVWQPKPFPPPPRQDHDRCGFGDDERWAK